MVLVTLLATSFVAMSFAPVGTAALPEPECMARYWEESVGPLTVKSRDTCTYEVYFNDGGVGLAEGAAVGVPECVDATPPGASDFGAKYCYDVQGPCYVTATYTYVWGEDTRCLVGTGPGAAATGPECFERYWEQRVGPVRIVSPDSCTYYVEYDGLADLTSAKAASGPGSCMERYHSYTVGDVQVVSRNSCHAEVYYQGQPILQ